jgi:hypothetical protein
VKAGYAGYKNIDLVAWKEDATDCIVWTFKIKNGIAVKEKMIANRSETKHLRRHIRQEDPSTARIVLDLLY